MGQGAKGPGSELAKERKGQAANWPGSYWPIRSWERIGPGAKRLWILFAPWPIRSQAISLPGTFAPAQKGRPFRSWERKFQGAKGPGSELARVLLADSLLGANWPGSVKARYPEVSWCRSIRSP